VLLERLEEGLQLTLQWGLRIKRAFKRELEVVLVLEAVELQRLH